MSFRAKSAAILFECDDWRIYPALMLTDTSFLRNPNYHQATDTPETLDYPRMTEVTLGVAAAMRRLLR